MSYALVPSYTFNHSVNRTAKCVGLALAFSDLNRCVDHVRAVVKPMQQGGGYVQSCRPARDRILLFDTRPILVQFD